MLKLLSSTLFLALALLTLPAKVSATVTVLDYWHMGDSDPAAANGRYVTNTYDSGPGGLTLTNHPTAAGVYPAYTNNVSALAAYKTGSQLSVVYTNGQSATAGLISNIVDNFGVELWVYPIPNSVGTQIIAYNGTVGTSGWGIYLINGTNYSVIFGGVTETLNLVPLATNQWTELALVRTNGLTTLYTNGVAALTATTIPISPTSGNFFIAGRNGSGTFVGAVDEVRVFTNAAGQFSPNDLSFYQPLVVTTATDTGPGSLRGAVAAAYPSNTITFAAGLSGQGIRLASGAMTVSNSMTIDGSALASPVQISSGAPIFQVNAGVQAIFNSLVITNSYQPIANNGALTLNNIVLANNTGYYGVVSNMNTLTMSNCIVANNSVTNGASIYNNGGTLTLNNCVFTGNRGGQGGGIDDLDGPVTVNNSMIVSNSTAGHGGGIYSEAATGPLILNSSSMIGNSAAGGGGGMYLSGGAGATLNDSTVANNSAIQGGGILAINGGVVLNNSTLAGNAASVDGGGVFSQLQPVALNNSTVANNSAPGAGGIECAMATLTATNSIVSLNSNSDIVASVGVDETTNLAPGVNNLIGRADSLLAPLGNYGGPTMTMPPMVGSPAIDAGDDAAASQFATDQRGDPRLSGAHTDIGAVEFQQTGSVVLTSIDGMEHSLRAAALYNPPGSTITFTNILAGQTLVLPFGEIYLSNSVTIDASSLSVGFEIHNGIWINGGGNFGIFSISSNATVLLKSVNLTNGNDATYGGGITCYGTLTLTNCVLADNVGGDAGGIYCPRGSGPLTLINCTLSDNLGGNAGGVDDSDGGLSLSGCTLNGNSGTQAGGIYAFDNGALVLNNSTLVNNSGLDAGSIYALANSGTLELNNCTLVDNTGGDADIAAIGGAMGLTNCIVTGGAGTFGEIYTSGATFAASSNLVDVANIGLEPLGNYGGPTMTMLPLPGSPALNAGNDAATGFLATDQRGYSRRSGSHVDIGAAEAQFASALNRPQLMNATWSGPRNSGFFSFTFTNSGYADFTVLATTNLNVPPANWTVVGNAVELFPNSFVFFDPGATNWPQRFYRVVSP